MEIWKDISFGDLIYIYDDDLILGFIFLYILQLDNWDHIFIFSLIISLILAYP